MKALFAVLLSATMAVFAEKAMDFPNAGFEEDAAAWSIPNNNYHSILKEAARSGEKGLAIIDKNPNAGSDISSPVFKVTPGLYYLTTCYSKSPDNCDAGLYHIYFDAKGKRLNSQAQGNEISIHVNAQQAWEANSILTCAPKQAATLRIWLHSFNDTTGTTYLDDFTMTELTREEATKKGIQISTGPKANFPVLDAQRIEELAKLLPDKPSLPIPPFSDRATWDAVAATPEAQNLIKNAEKLLGTPIPDCSDELYLLFTKEGNRTQYESVYFQFKSRLEQLARAELFENKGRFMPALLEMLNVYVNHRSWVLPAHDSSLTNFNNTSLYPDLFASACARELTCLLCLYQDKLPAELRQRIESEIWRRCLSPWQEAYRSGFLKSGLWWMHGQNNWNAVCTYNMVATALALMESKQDRAEALAAMEASNKYFYTSFTPDGYCSEGVGYWGYGFGHYLNMASLLWDITKGQLDLFRCHPVVRKACEYPRDIMIDAKMAPPFADCGFGARPSRSALILIQRQFPDALLQRVPGLKNAQIAIADMPVFAFHDEEPFYQKAPEQPTWPAYSYFPDAGVLITRASDAEKGTLGVAIKGGHNAELHNHNDVGSYLVSLNGTGFFVDPGGEVYSRRTFSRERYTSKVLNSYGHPVPVVGGQLQPTGRKACATFTDLVSDEQQTSVTIDMTQAYYPCKELKSLKRHFSFDYTNWVVTIRDEVEFSAPQTFEDALISAQFHVIKDGHSVLAYNSKAAMQADITAEGGAWKLTEEFIDNPKRVSPYRFAVHFEEPVLKATVTVKISQVPLDPTLPGLYQAPNTKGVQFDMNKAVRVQAENFVKEEGGHVVSEKKNSAEGTALKLWDGKDHALTWEFTIPQDGRYALQFRECLLGNDPSLRLAELDGKPLLEGKPLEFPSTGGWSNTTNDWKEVWAGNKGKLLVLDLKAGKHSLKLTNADNRGLNLDWFQAVPVK